MKAIISVLALAFASASAGAIAAAPVKVPEKVPYAQDNEIAGNVKRECELDTLLGEAIIEYAADEKFAIDPVAATNPGMPGRVLVVEIRDAVSAGNAFLGHRKSTSVRGALYVDGAKAAAFRARRDSMGGAFAGFKGSCSVLGRTVEALGEDIVEWLKDPRDGAELGDLE